MYTYEDADDKCISKNLTGVPLYKGTYRPLHKYDYEIAWHMYKTRSDFVNDPNRDYHFVKTPHEYTVIKVMGDYNLVKRVITFLQMIKMPTYEDRIDVYDESNRAYTMQNFISTYAKETLVVYQIKDNLLEKITTMHKIEQYGKRIKRKFTNIKDLK